jgi:Cu2+-exporting ATPase
MATPLAIAVALGRLAHRKILVKSGDVLQNLSQPGMIWLDKTGTLTHGKMQIVDWYGDSSWLPAVAELESQFNHPIAEAFLHRLNEQAADHDLQDVPRNIELTEARTGGVFAIVDGKPLLVGNRTLLDSFQVAMPDHDRLDCEGPDCEVPDWQQLEQKILAEQRSPCWIAFGGSVVALVGLGDSIRSESKGVVDEMKQLGWQVGILSGDHPDIVQSVADRLGIDTVHAGVDPEEKLATIQQSVESHGATVMVGDGVNDSAALAAATVGIAVKGGAEASLAAAPVYLGSAGLDSITELLKASKSTTTTIRANFVVSLGYNVLGVGLAMAGWLNPLVAAILMPISSLTVLTLSTRAARKQIS